MLALSGSGHLHPSPIEDEADVAQILFTWGEVTHSCTEAGSCLYNLANIKY